MTSLTLVGYSGDLWPTEVLTSSLPSSSQGFVEPLEGGAGWVHAQRPSLRKVAARRVQHEIGDHSACGDSEFSSALAGVERWLLTQARESAGGIGQLAVVSRLDVALIRHLPATRLLGALKKRSKTRSPKALSHQLAFLIESRWEGYALAQTRHENLAINDIWPRGAPLGRRSLLASLAHRETFDGVCTLIPALIENFGVRSERSMGALPLLPPAILWKAWEELATTIAPRLLYPAELLVGTRHDRNLAALTEALCPFPGGEAFLRALPLVVRLLLSVGRELLRAHAPLAQAGLRPEGVCHPVDVLLRPFLEASSTPLSWKVSRTSASSETSATQTLSPEFETPGGTVKGETRKTTLEALVAGSSGLDICPITGHLNAHPCNPPIPGFLERVCGAAEALLETRFADFATPEFLERGAVTPSSHAATTVECLGGNAVTGRTSSIAGVFLRFPVYVRDDLQLSLLEGQTDLDATVGLERVPSTLGVACDGRALVEDVRSGWLMDVDSAPRDALMRALRCASSEDERNKLHELLATWGNLEVVPRAYFVVGGRECEAQEFLSAAKVGDSYVFPWGAAIAEPTYQRHLESYLTRKKALVRLGHLTMAKLGALSSFLGFRPVSSSTNPMEYIRSLELCWSSESRALETALVQRLESFLSSGQADAGFEILRPYQRNGVAWIVARWMQGLGACLADEMGLGKTVQTICALRAYRVATEGQGRDSARAHPHLVVCPKSVLDVWARECARFAPEFAVKVVRQAGELEANQLQGVDIVVTTYARVRQSLMHFSQKPWGTLVLDEAQTIKNAATATAEALRTIPCDHRLALTGTPIENHAGELWSIVDWLNPGWLGKSHDFQAFTRMARDPEVARMSLSPIHEALRPILLRRLKTTPGVDVALPPKTYHTIAYTPAPEQLDVYSVLIEIAVSQSEELSQFKAAACFLRTILLARKLLNHPRCFYVGDEEDALVTHDDADRELQSRLISLARTKGCQGRLPTTSPSSAASNQRLAALTAPSGKLTALAELLENLSCASGGVLIFTQFHSSADLVREVARELSPEAWADVPYLHGGTTTEQRNAMVAAFQDKCASRDANVDAASAPAPLLVVSLRAGGTGITLTGARSVVHFDRWWNPAVEAQATDRAHRIGQKNAVTVYTFEAPATLDESLTRMHESKRSLADDLLGLSSAGQASQFLRGPEGFLELMDPQGLFQARVLGALGQRSSSSVRMADA